MYGAASDNAARLAPIPVNAPASQLALTLESSSKHSTLARHIGGHCKDKLNEQLKDNAITILNRPPRRPSTPTKAEIGFEAVTWFWATSWSKLTLYVHIGKPK